MHMFVSDCVVTCTSTCVSVHVHDKYVYSMLAYKGVLEKETMSVFVCICTCVCPCVCLCDLCNFAGYT